VCADMVWFDVIVHTYGTKDSIPSSILLSDFDCHFCFSHFRLFQISSKDSEIIVELLELCAHFAFKSISDKVFKLTFKLNL
jgi:hypothetical protein